MKKPVNCPILMLLAFFLTILASSCDEPSIGFPENDFPTDLGKPEGSTVTALDGEIIMEIPEGALDEPVRFSVNECLDNVPCEFVLKMIRIDPMVVFKEPVLVKLKYNGEHLNLGNNLSEGCSLTVCYWDCELDFLNRDNQKSTCCCLDTEEGVISFCITQTGVYAIRKVDLPPNGNPE